MSGPPRRGPSLFVPAQRDASSSPPARGPSPGTSPDTGGDRPRRLALAVVAVLDLLLDPAEAPSALRDGRAERILRLALDPEPEPDPDAGAAAAVRAACAHLRRGDLENTRTALRDAVDRLREV